MTLHLSDEQADELKDLLVKCTANVTHDGASLGTGFFVSNSLLLTCAHVVRGLDAVTVVPYAGAKLQAEVVAPDTERDLALLRIPTVNSDPEQPAVLLDVDLPPHDSVYFVAGFPSQPGQQPTRQSFTVTGRGAYDGAVPQWLVHEPGQIIEFGMSGGPVLSLRTGAVVAVTQSSRHTADALGGMAIPVHAACELYGEIEQFERDAPVAARPWRDVLGPALWRERGQLYKMETDVDLYLSGTGDEWCSKVTVVSEEGETLTGSKFNEGLTAAMFKWAQRRRLSAPEDVDLLCRLLSHSLFPPAVERHVLALAHADRVSIRLAIDSKHELMDIPWELASVPGAPTPITGDDRFRFFRVDEGAEPLASEPVTHLRVMGVQGVVEYSHEVRSKSKDWQDNSRFKSDFLGSFVQESTEKVWLPSCELADLDPGGATYDVLHYLGAGRVSHRGVAQFTVVDDAGNQDLKFHDIDVLFDRAEEAGARVLLLGFTHPPLLPALDNAVTPSSLGDVFAHGSLEAVVMTRFPLRPAQLRSFFKGFYNALERGALISDAVHAGRRTLKRNSGSDDPPDYASFVLITRPGGEVQLVQKQKGADDHEVARGPVRTPEQRPVPPRVPDRRQVEFQR